MGDRYVDLSVVNYKSHEDYLNSFATRKDIMYLGNRRVARGIAKLGFRSTNVPYDEREFARRTDLAITALRPKITGMQPFSRFMSPDNTDPVLLQFKKREIPIFNKVLATIVFTSYIHTDGSEISGYLDLGMSWNNAFRNAFRHTDWQGVYEGRSRLKPMSHHLSYRNQRSNQVLFTDSDNFKVMHVHGLQFMHKGDHKLIPVCGVKNSFSKNVIRTMEISPKYGTYIFYDHIVRKKV